MADARILIFVPIYNCECQIGRVLDQISDQTYAQEIIVVDNRSTDDSRDAALTGLRKLKIRAKLFQNDANYGLGGSHKVAFTYAIEQGFDTVIVLHGDDQARLSDLSSLVASGAYRDYDCLLGSRFMPGSVRENYSFIRVGGNVVFNLLFSLVTGRPVWDLGSGLNLYSVAAIRKMDYLTTPNDLTFNYYMILRSIAQGWKIRFFPICWRELDQISNVKMMRQIWALLKMVFAFVIDRQKFGATKRSGASPERYPSTLLFDSAPPTS